MHTVIHKVFHIREIHTILSKLQLELQTSNHQPYYDVIGKHIADMFFLKYQEITMLKIPNTEMLYIAVKGKIVLRLYTHMNTRKITVRYHLKVNTFA